MRDDVTDYAGGVVAVQCDGVFGELVQLGWVEDVESFLEVGEYGITNGEKIIRWRTRMLSSHRQAVRNKANSRPRIAHFVNELGEARAFGPSDRGMEVNVRSRR